MKENKRLKENKKNKRFSDHNEEDNFKQSRAKKDFKRKKLSIQEEESWENWSKYQEFDEDE